MSNFSTFFIEACDFRRMSPELRLGQALYTHLHNTRKEYADAVFDTELDPFYDDARVPAFLDHLMHEMDGEAT